MGFLVGLNHHLASWSTSYCLLLSRQQWILLPLLTLWTMTLRLFCQVILLPFDFFLPCHRMMVFDWSIMKGRCCPRCVHAILLSSATKRPTGQPRNSTIQWDAGSFVITIISSKSVGMAYGLTVVNSLHLLVSLPPCPKVIGVNPLSGLGINILTRFMLI
jgi:hypothetical protein